MKFMKDIKRVATIGVAFATLNTSAVFAGAIVKVTGTDVNIRSEANVSSDIVTTVDTGLTLSVSSLQDGWFKLENADGSNAYITTEFVKLTQADGTVNSAGVNIRTAPDTNAEVISQADEGDKLAITADVGEWYEVKYDKSFAYVHKDFVSGDMLKYLPTKKVSVTITPAEDNDSTASKGEEVVNYAKKFLGLTYVYGGTNLNSGVDCSGFMYCVYKNFGITLSRVSRDQINNGTRVDKSNLQPGDLVFFNTGGNSRISHVGMYMGNGQYIHATNNSKNCVQISSLNSSYSAKTYVGACRVLK